MGASPDGILENGELIQVKAPFSLRASHPADLASLNSSQMRSHFNEISSDGGLRLKRDHRYLWQMMAQMYVCGAKLCHFVT